jgi:hypothetical protein
MNPSQISYARAIFSLCLQAIERGVALPLSGLECALCEDNRTALLTLPDGRDGWICTTFELSKETDEGAFDPEPYVSAFENRED